MIFFNEPIEKWMIKISDYLFSQDFNINRKLLREYDHFITHQIKLKSGFCKDFYLEKFVTSN